MVEEKEIILILVLIIDIIHLSGYHSIPSELMLWSNQPALCVPIVSEALSLSRLLQIKYAYIKYSFS